MTVESTKAQLSQTNVQLNSKTLHHYLKLSVRTSTALITFRESFFALTPLTSDHQRTHACIYFSLNTAGKCPCTANYLFMCVYVFIHTLSLLSPLSSLLSIYIYISKFLSFWFQGQIALIIYILTLYVFSFILFFGMVNVIVL